MVVSSKTRIGKKGEILPIKELRLAAGIKPGDEVSIEAQPGELLIRKILSIDEIMKLPILSKVTPEEFEIEIEEEQASQMQDDPNEK